MATETASRTPMTISPDAAARHLGVSVGTLNNWRWSGKGPKYVKVGGRVRYRVSQLSDWLDARTRTSTSDDTRPAA